MGTKSHSRERDFGIVREALDRGLQAWRTTVARDEFMEAFDSLRRLEEQNERLRDLLRGFLHDADHRDIPHRGLRDKARQALDA